MLPGFAIGVAGMGVGERRLIRVPWRLGYGKKGKRPKIPPKPRSQRLVLLEDKDAVLLKAGLILTLTLR